jgi:3-dehydrosphinganine reductase
VRHSTGKTGVKNYQNTLVFVTGGSEGIGKAIAKAYLMRGAHVLIFSRSHDKLHAALTDLKVLRTHPQQKILAHPLDVTEERQTDAVMQTMIATHGTPDYVINCAGYARPGYLYDLSLDHYRAMMDLNYFGTVHVCNAVVPPMMQARQGSIVNTASIAGFIGLFGYTGYCASKYAVVGFSEAIRRELEPYSIRVSVLCPPNTQTPGLEEENKHKPREVLQTEEKVQSVDPDWVARGLMKGLAHNTFCIIPTWDGKLAHVLSRFTPRLLHQFVKRRASPTL